MQKIHLVIFFEHVDWDGNGEKDRLIDSRLFGYRAGQKGKAFDLALAHVTTI